MPESNGLDSTIRLTWNRLQALVVIFGPVLLIIGAFFALRSDVSAAQENAKTALERADEGLRSLNTINIRLERIQTVVERMDKGGR